MVSRRCQVAVGDGRAKGGDGRAARGPVRPGLGRHVRGTAQRHSESRRTRRELRGSRFPPGPVGLPSDLYPYGYRGYSLSTGRIYRCRTLGNATAGTISAPYIVVTWAHQVGRAPAHSKRRPLGPPPAYQSKPAFDNTCWQHLLSNRFKHHPSHPPNRPYPRGESA